MVVGLCGHGLSIARALHRNSVHVIALEANRALPGLGTRHAEPRIVPDINGDGLIESLVALRRTIVHAPRPVLFLTNDRMTETVGRHAELVGQHYRLSWARAADALLPLLRKDRIEARCAEVGMHYPKTVLMTDFRDVPQTLAGLRFPVIAKPTRPVSAFKTVVADAPDALLAARERIERSMPVIVQEFIPGDDTVIRFGALFLHDGEVLARFEGRKLRSRPLGHTTIAVSEPDDEIHALARTFFEGLKLSGPVSLELKRGPDGRQWVIEPTVGRTDFWVDLCVANGVNLPLAEYLHAVGAPVPPMVQRREVVWINGERDPGALPWLLGHQPAALRHRRIRGLYFDFRDPRPFLTAAARFLGQLPGRAARRAARVLPGQA